MNDRGFSLIEVIIVIAISSILIGGAFISLNLLVFADTKKCAKEIDVILNKLRLQTLSKGMKYHYVVIEWNDLEKNYYLNMVTSSGELTESTWRTDADTITSNLIADSNITIQYSDRLDGTNIFTINRDNPCLLISMKPDSGAFRTAWKQIIISSRSNTTTIFMVTKTGKHYIEE